jgi:hypothetical protein
MNLRAMNESDLIALKEIHAKYYADEFKFPDFYHHCLGAFVVEEDNHIITGGCLKLTTEAILLTNRDSAAKNRVKALISVLELNKFLAGKAGFDQIHAFIKVDPAWRKLMFKYQFQVCKGESLVLNVERVNNG